MSQSGLHAEMCEIDHQLHSIVAGRKRNVLQTIQEETATNIYFPSPLQGLMGPDLNSAVGGSQTSRISNVIWITGEFFGVQRARDMLYSVSLNKVPFISDCRTATNPKTPE
jgi:KH domain